MRYYIKRTDDTLLLENGLPENIIDTNTIPLALIGKLTADYGTAQSENFVRLLENFAKEEAPSNPLTGMIWFNNLTIQFMYAQKNQQVNGVNLHLYKQSNQPILILVIYFMIQMLINSMFMMLD